MKEQRNSNFDVKNIPESRTVEGYALVFNKESRFKEIIDASSLDGKVDKVEGKSIRYFK